MWFSKDRLLHEALQLGTTNTRKESATPTNVLPCGYRGPFPSNYSGQDIQAHSFPQSSDKVNLRRNNSTTPYTFDIWCCNKLTDFWRSYFVVMNIYIIRTVRCKGCKLKSLNTSPWCTPKLEIRWSYTIILSSK